MVIVVSGARSAGDVQLFSASNVGTGGHGHVPMHAWTGIARCCCSVAAGPGHCTQIIRAAFRVRCCLALYVRTRAACLLGVSGNPSLSHPGPLPCPATGATAHGRINVLPVSPQEEQSLKKSAVLLARVCWQQRHTFLEVRRRSLEHALAIKCFQLRRAAAAG